MRKLASPGQLVTELRRILAYCEQPNPSRIQVAHQLKALGERVAATRLEERVAARSRVAAMGESDFWSLIEPYGWGTKSRNYKAIKKDLMGKLSPDEAEELGATYRKLSNKLYKVLDGVVEGLGDDGFGDLIAHIIGMGRREYEAVLKDPELGAVRANAGDFGESFAYALPGKHDYESLNVGKYVVWAQKVVDAYGAVLKADEDDIPWLPKMKKDLTLVLDAMADFTKTKDFHALLDKDKDLRSASENIEKYLGKLSMGGFSFPEEGSFEDSVRQAANKWLVWNLLTDLRDFLT